MNHARPVGLVAHVVGFATLVFVLLPLPFIVIYAFNPSSYGLLGGAPTLRWFASFFSNPRFMAALENSAAISVLTTVAASLIAIPTALVAVRGQFPGRRLLLGMVSAPLVVPGVIVGTAALGFVSQCGIGTGFWPLTVAMICLTLPLAMRPLIANLAGLDPDLERAARNLGAGPARAFLGVTLPQLSPGLVSGATFAFVEAMDNFAVAAFLSSVNTTTLPVESYSYIRDIDDPTVAAMASVLILFSLTMVYLIEKLLGVDKFLDLG